MSLDLPTVTMICADCIHAQHVVPVMEHCKTMINFGAVKLLTSQDLDYQHVVKIQPLNSLNDYSAFCLAKLHEYVQTEHMLVVQHDGWPLNPQSWTSDWLQLDYLGPLFMQYDIVASGGFSLRSKRLMEAVTSLCKPWDGKNSWNKEDGKNFWAHEDGVIALDLRPRLEARGLKFASIEQAIDFAYGGNPRQGPRVPFGFHGFWSPVVPMIPEHLLQRTWV